MHLRNASWNSECREKSHGTSLSRATGTLSAIEVLADTDGKTNGTPVAPRGRGPAMAQTTGATKQPARSNLWALVLAGGDGRRLQELTRTIAGVPIPKQYCRITGDRSLLEATLARVEPLAARARTAVIITRSHLGVARDQLRAVPRPNVLVQPHNRDTGPGLVFSLLRLARRRPDATVAVFPSDHYVADDAVFMGHVTRAVRIAEEMPRKVVLLGIEPDSPEPGYGYIELAAPVAAAGAGSAFHVAAFREKPVAAIARDLFARGALWNSFVMVFKLGRMLELLERARPADVARMRATGRRARGATDYATLPAWNFSADFLAHIPRDLIALRCGATGWNDWGTPEAIERTFATLGQVPPWRSAKSASAA